MVNINQSPRSGRQIVARQFVLLTATKSHKPQASSVKRQALRHYATLTQNVGVRQNAIKRI